MSGAREADRGNGVRSDAGARTGGGFRGLFTAQEPGSPTPGDDRLGPS